MAKRKHPFKSVAHLNQGEWYESLESESDRGAALIAGETLSTALELLLRHVMPNTAKDDLFQGSAPLASFYARTNIAFAFGLVDEDSYRDLNLIRDIRNEFGHGILSLTFDSPPIASRVREFSILKKVTAADVLDYPDDELPEEAAKPLNVELKTYRQAFLFETVILLSGIHSRAEDDHIFPTYEQWSQAYYARLGVPGWEPPEPNIRPVE
jgi:DNA-binding MltR family transcriptional regulator